MQFAFAQSSRPFERTIERLHGGQRVTGAIDAVAFGAIVAVLGAPFARLPVLADVLVAGHRSSVLGRNPSSASICLFERSTTCLPRSRPLRASVAGLERQNR